MVGRSLHRRHKHAHPVPLFISVQFTQLYLLMTGISIRAFNPLRCNGNYSSVSFQ